MTLSKTKKAPTKLRDNNKANVTYSSLIDVRYEQYCNVNFCSKHCGTISRTAHGLWHFIPSQYQPDCHHLSGEAMLEIGKKVIALNKAQ